MSREYIVSGDNLTVVSTQVMEFLNPKAAPSSGVEVLRSWASQRANATSAQLGVAIFMQPTGFPTMSSAGATPGLLKLGDPISLLVAGVGTAGTAGINGSASGTGTQTLLYPDNFNALNGWLWVATPPETFTVGAGATSGVGTKWTMAPGTLTGWSFGIVYRETA